MAKSKKKKEKKADFAVADPPPPAVPDGVENQAEGRQGKTQASQLHRYFLQVSKYGPIANDALIMKALLCLAKLSTMLSWRAKRGGPLPLPINSQ